MLFLHLQMLFPGYSIRQAEWEERVGGKEKLGNDKQPSERSSLNLDLDISGC